LGVKLFLAEVPRATIRIVLDKQVLLMYNTNIMRHIPKNMSDRVAKRFTLALRWTADTFFSKRRAVVLETVAAVPGMVAGILGSGLLRRLLAVGTRSGLARRMIGVYLG